MVVKDRARILRHPAPSLILRFNITNFTNTTHTPLGKNWFIFWTPSSQNMTWVCPGTFYAQNNQQDTHKGEHFMYYLMIFMIFELAINFKSGGRHSGCGDLTVNACESMVVPPNAKTKYSAGDVYYLSCVHLHRYANNKQVYPLFYHK